MLLRSSLEEKDSVLFVGLEFNFKFSASHGRRLESGEKSIKLDLISSPPPIKINETDYKIKETFRGVLNGC